MGSSEKNNVRVGMRGNKSADVGKQLLQGAAVSRGCIIVPPRVEDGFLERWRRALSEDPEVHEEMSIFDGHWEYQVAVKDLNRNHSRSGQHHDPVLTPHIFLQWFLWRELRTYGDHLNRVVKINRALRKCSETLSVAHAEVSRVAAHAGLECSLGPLFEELFEVPVRFCAFGKDYWDRVFCVGSFREEYKKRWDDDVRRFPKMRNISGYLSLPELRQERNLDTIFQVRVGDLLREFVPNPYGRRLPLQTISRLVLLVYICAGLARDLDGSLTICKSDPPRILTVDKTYETLRDAGVK
jgi:hypothetical protein